MPKKLCQVGLQLQKVEYFPLFLNLVFYIPKPFNDRSVAGTTLLLVCASVVSLNLGRYVSSVNPELGSSNVCRRVASKEDDCSLEIFGYTEPAHGGQSGPRVFQFGIVIQDSSCERSDHVSSCKGGRETGRVSFRSDVRQTHVFRDLLRLRAMLLTRMFRLAHSTARDDAMCFTAAFDALYGLCG